MQSYQLFIGIDISKKWIDVCVSFNGQIATMPHAQFINDANGFQKMLNFVSSYAKKHKITGQWLFCMEHTGIYVLSLCSFLEQQGLAYVLQSALQIIQSIGLRRSKSDAHDAAHITRYAFLHQQELRPTKLPSQNLLKIKHLLSLRNRLVKARKSFKVAANELKNSTTTASCIESTSATACAQLTEHIKQTEQEIQQLISASATLNQTYKLLISIKGIGLVVAAHLLVYTNGFTAFKNARQFACYIGIAPFGYASGSSIKQPDRVSHLANKKLKTLISSAAISAIRFDKQIKAYYQRKIEDNKNRFLVQNNVKNKIIHRVFAVVKRGTPYVELDQFNA